MKHHETIHPTTHNLPKTSQNHLTLNSPLDSPIELINSKSPRASLWITRMSSSSRRRSTAKLHATFAKCCASNSAARAGAVASEARHVSSGGHGSRKVLKDQTKLETSWGWILKFWGLGEGKLRDFEGLKDFDSSMALML